MYWHRWNLSPTPIRLLWCNYAYTIGQMCFPAENDNACTIHSWLWQNGMASRITFDASPGFRKGGGVFQIYNANLLLPILWTNWKQFDGLNIFSITSLQFQIPRRSTLYKWWGKIRSTGFRKLDSHKRIGVELQQIDKLPTWGYTCAQKWCGNLRPRYSALYVGQNFEKKSI